MPQNWVLQNLLAAHSPTLAYFEKVINRFSSKNCLNTCCHHFLLRNSVLIQYDGAKSICSYGFERPPWTPMKLLQLAMNLQCLKSVIHSHYSSLLAGISLDKSSASHQNSPATVTILIKPEHLCVEQAFLYPWMCCTSWFELHRSQDKCFSTTPLQQLQ